MSKGKKRSGARPGRPQPLDRKSVAEGKSDQLRASNNQLK
nr:phage DNA packaging protein J [Staphylococcus aureus]